MDFEQMSQMMIALVDAMTDEELGRLVEIKRGKMKHAKGGRWDAALKERLLENVFLRRMAVEHGFVDIVELRILPPLSFEDVDRAFLARRRDARITGALGGTSD